jgi:valine--pyruvate aminotransferase
MLGIYQSPQGAETLLEELAAYFQSLGWPVAEENICITNGSQSAFFMLINMFSGESESGLQRKICLPIVPEYLGYADQGLHPNAFDCRKPLIKVHGEHGFRYEIDFDQLVLDESSSALCVSRPTNPSGNVLSRADMERLGELADAHNIPLIVDCAYGAPFPNIVYEGETLPWQKNRIFVMSLSKLGLPGARTGIVVADRTLIKKLSSANTVLSLASGNLGPALLTQMLQDTALDEICRDVLFPFYLRKREEVLSLVSRHLEGIPYRIHDADGAFFVWLWFEGLPVPSSDLYRRLKDRGVLVMDGEHFFFGQFEDWSHSRECLRLSYCAEKDVLDRALNILSEELRALSW